MSHREEHDDGSTTTHVVCSLHGSSVRRRNEASASSSRNEPNHAHEANEGEHDEREPEEENHNMSEEDVRVRSRTHDRKDPDGHEGDGDDMTDLIGMVAPACRDGEHEIARLPLRSQLDTLAQRLTRLRSSLNGDSDPVGGCRPPSDWMAMHGNTQAREDPQQPVCNMARMQGLRPSSLLRVEEELRGRVPCGCSGSRTGDACPGGVAEHLPRRRDEREDHEGQADGVERKRAGDDGWTRVVGK